MEGDEGESNNLGIFQNLGIKEKGNREGGISGNGKKKGKRR